MGAEEIKKKIRRHTIGKIVVLVVLCITVFVFLYAALVRESVLGSLITYFAVLIVLIVVYKYPLNVPLSRCPSVIDYKGILEYLRNVSDDLNGQMYYDGLVMIKNSLNEIVYHGLNEVESQDSKNNIMYLQEIFRSENKRKMFSEKLYCREYVRHLCDELYQQFIDNKFQPHRIEEIKVDAISIKHRKRTIPYLVIAKVIASLFLVGLIVFKFSLTINIQAYESIGSNDVYRVIYNIGADFVAIAIILIDALIQKKSEG